MSILIPKLLIHLVKGAMTLLLQPTVLSCLPAQIRSAMANFPETQELLGTFICLKSTHAKLVPNGLEPAKVLPIAALLLASSQTVTNKLNERSEEKLKKIFRTLKSVTIKADISVPLFSQF